MKFRNTTILFFSILIFGALFWKHLPIDITRKIRASDLNAEANDIIVLMHNNEASIESIENGIQLLEKAIELDSLNTTYITNLMKFFDYKKQYQNNLELVNKLLIIHPNDAGIYLNRGVIFTKLGDIIKAERDFNKSLNIVNNRAKLDLSEGEIIKNILIYGHFKKYKNVAQELVKLNTKYPESPFYEVLLGDQPDSIKKYLEVLNENN